MYQVTWGGFKECTHYKEIFRYSRLTGGRKCTSQGRFGVIPSIHYRGVRRIVAPRRSLRAEMVRRKVSLFPFA